MVMTGSKAKYIVFTLAAAVARDTSSGDLPFTGAKVAGKDKSILYDMASPNMQQ